MFFIMSLLLLSACGSTAAKKDPNDGALTSYERARAHLEKGRAFFREAMEGTSGGSARADLCSKSRQEYFKAAKEAEEYDRLTGQGEDLLQEIQMNDYSAMKMAPTAVWSPPESDDEEK